MLPHSPLQWQCCHTMLQSQCCQAMMLHNTAIKALSLEIFLNCWNTGTSFHHLSLQFSPCHYKKLPLKITPVIRAGNAILYNSLQPKAFQCRLLLFTSCHYCVFTHNFQNHDHQQCNWNHHPKGCHWMVNHINKNLYLWFSAMSQYVCNTSECHDITFFT